MWEWVGEERRMRKGRVEVLVVVRRVWVGIFLEEGGRKVVMGGWIVWEKGFDVVGGYFGE